MDIFRFVRYSTLLFLSGVSSSSANRLPVSSPDNYYYEEEIVAEKSFEISHNSSAANNEDSSQNKKNTRQISGILKTSRSSTLGQESVGHQKKRRIRFPADDKNLHEVSRDP